MHGGIGGRRITVLSNADYLYVYLANRAIGAGGGNTSGGNYRTKDGLTWEKRMDRGWEAVETAQL